MAQSMTGPSTINSTSNLFGALNKQARPLRPIGQNLGPSGGHAHIGTDIISSFRAVYKTIGGVSVLQLCYANNNTASSGEGTSSNPYIVRATIETATQVIQAYPGMQNPNLLDLVVPNKGQVCMTPTPTFIPAATTFEVRTFARVSGPPTSPAASVVSGGALAAATTYYYKFTNVDNTLESGPTSEVTCTTGATVTLACSLSWAANLYTNGVNVYRSTSTGTEVYLAQIPAGQNSFTDLGTITAGSATPPAQNTYYYSRQCFTGESANSVSAGGNGSDQTQTTGAMTGLSCPSVAAFLAPSLLLGDDTTAPSYCMIGDSIPFGGGLSTTFSGASSFYLQNWFEQGMTGLHSANYSIGGTQIQTLVGKSAGITAGRWFDTLYCDYVFSDHVRNDLSNGQTWQQIATNHLLVGTSLTNRGVRYVITTAIPDVTTTDNTLTIANQTAVSFETARQNYNTWVRGGMQVDGSGAPVLSAGTPTTNIYSYVDVAAPIEVNNSNVVTANGGFWLVPTVADYTGQVASGSPTVTSIVVSGATYPTAGLGLFGKEVKITSGSANGQVAIILSNTATTLTLLANNNPLNATANLVGLTIAPAAGDTFSIWSPNGTDGIHPGLFGHNAMSAKLTAWISAMGGIYGATR